MAKRFCPKCGVPITQGTFCSKCTPQEEVKIVIPPVQISEYNRTYEKKTWHSFSHVELLIIHRIQDVVGKTANIKLEPFEFIPRAKNKTTVIAHINLDGKFFKVPVSLSYRQCDIGQKQKSGYFEGILQLRHPPKDIEVHLERETKNMAKRGAFITQVIPVKNGLDLYLTDKHQMQLFASRLINHYGGSMQSHPTLFSHNHQTSKDIYRLTVLVEFPLFTKGSVISFIPVKIRGEGIKLWYHIKKMGKLIQGVNLLTGKAVSVEQKFMSEVEVIPKQETSIVQIHPDILVLDPQTYQAETLVNSNILKKKYISDQKVFIVQSEKGLLLVEE